MAMTCQKAGCTKAATHALQIGCGTHTDPDECPPRAKILMGLVVCEEHLDEADAGPFFAANPALRQLFALAMSGGPPPDIDRAVILGVPLDSQEYRELQIQQLKH